MLKFTRRRTIDLSHMTRPGVRVVDVMPCILPNGVPPNMLIDHAIVQAARVSYGEGSKGDTKDRGLIRYLLRNNHTSPFEMVEFKFHLEMPLFIARQWMRHRMASINEISARYTKVPEDKRFIPIHLRDQSTDNKQCSDGKIICEETIELWEKAIAAQKTQWTIYDKLCRKGVAREQARMLLPQNTVTEFYWKIDLHNLLKFLELRTHTHAQEEIRVIANHIMDLLCEICPTTMEAWQDYRQNSVSFSHIEQRAVKDPSLLSPSELKILKIKTGKLTE